MTPAQVKDCEDICNKMIADARDVYPKEAPLAESKAIKGLRAVFDETYPDPVRVLSIGVPVEELLSDPNSSASMETSVEFCGGTHVRNSKHIGAVVIVAEEAIAKGIRRIIAVTGNEAEKAGKKFQFLSKMVDDLSADVRAQLGSKSYSQKKITQKIQSLTEEVGSSQISQWLRDNLRNSLKSLKKEMDNMEKQRKTAVIAEVGDEAKKLIEDNPDPLPCSQI